MDATEQKLRSLVAEKLTEPEFADTFLLDVEVSSDNKVNVYMDSDTGISFDKCRIVSRHLEEYLDEAKPLGERYTLSVSSPGATKPLQIPRQYPKHVGRTLKVKTNEDEKIEGELVEVTDTHIVLTYVEITREKKKKIKTPIRREIPFAEIQTAKVKLSFK